MRSMFSLSLLLTTALSGAVAQAADAVGVKKISVVSQETDRPLAVTLWYPSTGDGEPFSSGANRIFDGSPASKNAGIRDGQFPLVLLSHGSGSRAEGMAWIATQLAEAGFIVAGTNHPGTTSSDSTPAATLKLWERTQDISTIITALSADRQWKMSIDPARIGILGFSLGGTTALELAGARGDLAAYRRYCADMPDMMDCRWMRGDRGYADGEPVTVEPFDLARLDRVRFEASHPDARIKAVVAVDPGLAMAFQPDSLAAITTSVAFINLGSRGHIPPVVLSDGLAAKVPGATYTQVDDANHFSFLPVCKTGAEAFLASVGETDPICTGTARPRTDIHAQLSRLIVDDFTRLLKPGN